MKNDEKIKYLEALLVKIQAFLVELDLASPVARECQIELIDEIGEWI